MKKLVLCSDGTGNSSAKAQKTNVWRMFQAVDQATSDQLAKYDDGVGTSSIKFLAAAGGAFGYGLKRNVIDLYKFVCRKYEHGDEIYGFGFSRGAYTIRVVMALIDSQGLVTGRSESELHANAVMAYRRYRSARYPSHSPVVWVGRRLRDLLLHVSTRKASADLASLPPWRREVPIRFLGLWDTVAAYGMPVDELRWGISLLIWPMTPIDRFLGLRVQRACHALSLDDQRKTFHPILFDEQHEAALVARDVVPAGRLTQVWFSGAHSNVGGGYPEDRQSLVTLDWMMSQAQDAGLRLHADSANQVAEDKSAFARLYDSRRGLAAYYRYAPRLIDMGCDTNGRPIRAIVHGSVVMRMFAGSDAYAPISLPREFNVLAPDGALIPMAGFEDDAQGAVGSLPKLPASTTAVDRIEARTINLKAVIAAIGLPGRELVQQIGDTVWWRRVTYFACLLFTLALIAFPIAADFYAAVVGGAIRGVSPALSGDTATASSWLDTFLGGVILPWMSWLKIAAPQWAVPWLDALGRKPFEMIAAIAWVAIPYFAGTFLAQRIHDRAWFAWHPGRQEDYVAWVLESAHRSLVKAEILFAMAIVLLLAAHLGTWKPELIGLLTLVALVLAVVLLWRVRILVNLRRGVADRRPLEEKIPTTPALYVARALRSSRRLGVLADLVSLRIIPLAFAMVLLWGIVGGANHFVARTIDSGGAFCESTPESALTGVSDTPQVAAGRFDPKSMCWATGIRVAQGVAYDIVLDASASPPWCDAAHVASVAGIAHPTALYSVALPFRRSWDFDWFVPILRVGTLGNDERRLSPMAGPTGGAVAGLTFKAQNDGELFLYVNDTVAALPGVTGFFYANNQGSATLTVAKATPGNPLRTTSGAQAGAIDAHACSLPDRR